MWAFGHCTWWLNQAELDGEAVNPVDPERAVDGHGAVSGVRGNRRVEVARSRRRCAIDVDGYGQHASGGRIDHVDGG